MDKSEEELKLPIVPANNNSLVPQPEQEYPLTLHELTLNALLSGFENYLIPENKDLLALPPELPAIEPFQELIEDRNLAFSLINELILSAIEFRKIILQDDGIVCPYQRTLTEYLGPNYKIPSINDLTLPPTFSYPATMQTISEFQNKTHEKMSDHLNIMVKEAADTSFVGITSENLGNAFAVLSGSKYVIDKEKLAKHLEFDEILRNLPQDVIEDQPYLTAFKLICRYNEIV